MFSPFHLLPIGKQAAILFHAPVRILLPIWGPYVNFARLLQLLQLPGAQGRSQSGFYCQTILQDIKFAHMQS
jgi:hypothetical protein